jgi:hypothetical protein
LTDILENIEAIVTFTADMTFETYTSDLKTVYAVTRALEIISEASRRLPNTLKARRPVIDWAGVAAAAWFDKWFLSESDARFCSTRHRDRGLKRDPGREARPRFVRAACST